MNMKTIAALAAVTAAAGCCCFKQGAGKSCCYPSSINEGFVALFNGYDLEGWEGATEMYGIDPAEP